MTDTRLFACVAWHEGRWPKECYSGVMFFDGLRITIADFMAVINGNLR